MGAGEEPRPIIVLCNARRANRRSEQREPHNCDKKCDEGKTTYLRSGTNEENSKI